MNIVSVLYDILFSMKVMQLSQANCITSLKRVKQTEITSRKVNGYTIVKLSKLLNIEVCHNIIYFIFD